MILTEMLGKWVFGPWNYPDRNAELSWSLYFLCDVINRLVHRSVHATDRIFTFLKTVSDLNYRNIVNSK
jgi:hypothetical protein